MEFCLRLFFMAKAMMPEDQHPGMVNPDHFGQLLSDFLPEPIYLAPLSKPGPGCRAAP
jgi:hypothetical protein